MLVVFSNILSWYKKVRPSFGFRYYSWCGKQFLGLDAVLFLVTWSPEWEEEMFNNTRKSKIKQYLALLAYMHFGELSFHLEKSNWEFTNQLAFIEHSLCIQLCNKIERPWGTGLRIIHPCNHFLQSNRAKLNLLAKKYMDPLLCTRHRARHWVSSVQSLSHVWLFVTPWTAARQASLSITNSWSLLKLMSIELVMPSNHLILGQPLLFLP